MKVLVTGGAGYIGSHVVRRLADAGHTPVVLDSLRSGAIEAVGDATLIVADVRDGSALDTTFHASRFDAVIHMAALKSPFESLRDPGLYFDVNVNGTLAVLEAMRRHDVGAFVYSSSCAVYGIPERLPIDESAALAPTTPYGESKLLAERLLPWYPSIRAAVLRYFNAAGAMEDGSLGEDWGAAINLIPLVLRAALGHADHVEIYGSDYPTPDGTAVRDYVHVLDLADAHVAAMEQLVNGSDERLTLNLGTGTGVSVAEVISAVEQVTGRPVPTTVGPRRDGDPAAIWADPQKAQAVLGWQARRDLRTIVATAARWHELHPAGFPEHGTTARR